MNPKPFRTHNDLIKLLESRGMDFSAPNSKGTAKKNLQRIGYYNLINGYATPFYDSSLQDTFLNGTTLDEIMSLYLFDRKMREVLLRYILPVETNIKSLIAYYFPQQHKEEHYLVYENFDTHQRDSSKRITNLIYDIHRQISGRVSDPSISHYLNNYGYIPLWVLNNILTMGIVSKFYSLMHQNERQSVSNTFGLSDDVLENILLYLSSIRNICAHGNRLYCYRSRRPLIDMPMHANLNIPKTNGEYAFGKRDLLAVYIALRYVISRSDYYSLLKETKGAVSELAHNIHTIPVQTVLDSMGFPAGWKNQLYKA